MEHSIKESDGVKEVVMIGAGPSSLAAAIYTTREDIETTLYEKSTIGGLAAITDVVDNYPGFPEGVEGLTLAGQLEKQAERFGAQIEFGDVTSLRDAGEYKVIVVDGKEVKAKVVLIATGSDYKKIGITGETELYGRGVHYCATCDGAFYRDKKLVVIGGGNSAFQEALFLTRYASHIDLLVRSEVKASDVLQRDMQKFVEAGKVTVHVQTTTQEIVATDGHVTAVKAIKANEPITFDTDGVFVFVGLLPNTQFLAGSGIELDARGLIKTDEQLRTNIKGVFASGDVRSGATMQIASAVGEGASAALSIREYLEDYNRDPSQGE
ncbi:MAG: thioredoxin reductase [Candidatus Microsaccharimonas sossegonensis]|uniref:Thioredoxin reductase n=1 Tax=Candidatus Microsaccharimonas sossegonensis TaxID=2506948 RepID=A0A4Q0AI48_9BACT|nr:MAG: thioredoxin reductase [Candidatus Microsaccharimonas sossegonensis]